MQKVIALFGATGSTGREFIELAIQENYGIRALVRSPEKLKEVEPDVQIIKGDFSNQEAISQVIEHSDFVVCLAGSLKAPQRNLMYNFIKLLHPLMMRHKVSNIFYQAGAMCYVPGRRRYLAVMFMRETVGRITGFETSLADHDQVLKYFHTSMVEDGLNVTVTLPGALGLSHGFSEKVAKIHRGIKYAPSKYIEVARFTLENLANEKLYGKYVYIA